MGESGGSALVGADKSRTAELAAARMVPRGVADHMKQREAVVARRVQEGLRRGLVGLGVRHTAGAPLRRVPADEEALRTGVAEELRIAGGALRHRELGREHHMAAVEAHRRAEAQAVVHTPEEVAAGSIGPEEAGRRKAVAEAAAGNSPLAGEEVLAMRLTLAIARIDRRRHDAGMRG